MPSLLGHLAHLNAERRNFWQMRTCGYGLLLVSGVGDVIRPWPRQIGWRRAVYGNEKRTEGRNDFLPENWLGRRIRNPRTLTTGRKRNRLGRT